MPGGTYTLQPVTIAANTNHTGVTRLGGFSIRESAATAAPVSVNLRLATATGQILFPLELAANESAGIVFSGHISAPGGVYVEIVGTGTIEGVLFDME